MFKNKPIVVFVSTYPPRECGIATFTQDLLRSSRRYVGTQIVCKVAALNHSPLTHYVYPPEVAWELNQNNKTEHLNLAKTINNNLLISGVILQHEYGIYGGENGENILLFTENCRKPLLVTLHTVLPDPTPKMKTVTSRIIRSADIIVVLTENSRKILETVYPFAIGKVYVIPHGIHHTAFAPTDKTKKKLKLTDSTILSTFGLLSRGKGIEYVIRALPEIIKHDPSVLYLVLGETHPSVRREEGERYRLELIELVNKLHLKKHVKFYDQYMDLDDVIEFLHATDIYLSTSINPNQAVSGTLSYAMGAGCAVVSTAFAQAKEIVTPKNGRLVPVKDSAAICIAVQDILHDRNQLEHMRQNAYDSTRSMLWSHVAEEYANLLTQLVLPPINLKYLKKMTDDFGLFQFATFGVPDPTFGYTLDDNARALIVINQLISQNGHVKGFQSFVTKYLKFIATCQQADGSFINYIDHLHKQPTEQNQAEDLSDAMARAIWAVAETMRNSFLSSDIRKAAEQIFLRTLPRIEGLPHLRSRAFIIKGLVAAYDDLPDHQPELYRLITSLADALASALKLHTTESWTWFEDHLRYNNAILPESLLLAGKFLDRSEYFELGIASLQFLINETFATNMYAPIGHAHWYQRNEERSYYDQQPEDPAAMILALTTAYKLTGYISYKNLADKCFSWFLGNNSLHQPLYDYETGGCYDGLHPDRVNLNQGAESLLSYLLARLAINEIDLYAHSTAT